MLRYQGGMKKPLIRRLAIRSLTSLTAIGAVSIIFAAKAMDAEQRHIAAQKAVAEEQLAALP